MAQEVKKITLGLILSWIFGIFFLLGGVGVIAQGSYIPGILIIICSAMIIPYFNKIAAEKFHFQISGGIKFVLVIVILILMGVAMSKSPGLKNNDSDVVVKPTENVNPSAQNNTNIQTQQPPAQPPKQKIKSATLSIDRVQIQLANLYPTRVTVTNTGDVPISPKFDLYVYDTNNKEVCSGSPLFDEMRTLSSEEKQTGEISIMGCMFNEDGTYMLKIDLLDSDYTRLDSQTKEFTVDYWDKFNLG